jgi:hypothetical protein
METLNYGCNKFYDTVPRLKRPVKDKHSRLLQIFVNYGRKMFCNMAKRLTLCARGLVKVIIVVS